MTAPEIDVHEEEQMYFIPVGNYCIPMCIDDWTLIEEEQPEKQTSEYFKETDYDKQSGQQEPEYYQHFDTDC